MPILPETGSGCWPQVPLAWADVPYLRATQKRLNTMLAQQAAANGAVYVDAYTAAIGKDACKSSGTRWIEPLIPGNTAAPFHPNARGMAGITPAVVAAAS
jgi:GDSL-like Lipase/Acylhydrolase family